MSIGSIKKYVSRVLVRVFDKVLVPQCKMHDESTIGGPTVRQDGTTRSQPQDRHNGVASTFGFNIGAHEILCSFAICYCQSS